jgi:hypothetical protein
MRKLEDATMADVFADYAASLLRSRAYGPYEKIEQVRQACKELEAWVQPRPHGRPSNALRDAEKELDPFCVPLLTLARDRQREGVKALADPAAQAVQDLLDGKVVGG